MEDFLPNFDLLFVDLFHFCLFSSCKSNETLLRFIFLCTLLIWTQENMTDTDFDESKNRYNRLPKVQFRLFGQTRFTHMAIWSLTKIIF